MSQERVPEAKQTESQLQRELRQRKPFASRREEGFLALQRTAGVLMQRFARKLREHALTTAQYNVLRILRGARPQALTCSAIGERLVTPGPDVTRLVDRLVRRQLVSRRRDARDRRVVRVQITPAGLGLLDALDEPVVGWLEDLLEPLDDVELQTLIRLLAAVRRQA